MKQALLFLSLVCGTVSFADDGNKEEKKPSHTEIKREKLLNAPKKSRAWSFELAGLRYLQHSSTGGHPLSGEAVRLSLGYGLLTTRRIVLGEANLYLGPFANSYKSTRFDYAGSGLNLTVGTSIGSQVVRNNSYSVGILGGFSYTNSGGRYYARKDVDEPAPTSTAGLVVDYRNVAESWDLNFGPFVSLIKEERADTNEMESLITRNEGVVLSFQASLPVWSRMRSKYILLDSSGHQTNKTEKFPIAGMKFIVSLRTFLGT